MTVSTDPASRRPSYGNTYNQLLEFLAPVDLTFYMLMVGSVLMLRIKDPGADRPYRTFAYPVPLVFYLTVAGLLVADFIYLEPKTAGIGYAIALAGIPVYWLRSLTQSNSNSKMEPPRRQDRQGQREEREGEDRDFP